MIVIKLRKNTDTINHTPIHTDCEYSYFIRSDYTTNEKRAGKILFKGNIESCEQFMKDLIAS